MADVDVERLLDQVQTAVDAASASAAPLLEKVQAADDSLDFAAGLSLLLVRPHVLLESVHNLAVLLALRLHGAAPPDAAASSALARPFAEAADAGAGATLADELAGQLVRAHEVLDKVRGMEGKLEYQVKKLVGLAEEDAKGRVVDDNVEDDLLAFRPNIGAIAESSKPRAAETADADDGGDGVYRPPRVAAVPYPEAGPSSTRRERRAPALLSEFAASLDSAPVLESTSGLSVRPAHGAAHSNSLSAKRAAELRRINEWEEDNMTRLVTSKREAKRRREDEEALAMGYGVGGARNRRRNGLEAELEGVLGERGRSAWDAVRGDLGREDRGERAKRVDKGVKGGGKRRFEKDVKRKR